MPTTSSTSAGYVMQLQLNSTAAADAAPPSISNNDDVSSSLGLPLDPSSQAVLIILYSVTTLVSVSGNLLVIGVFTCGSRSRTSSLRLFLVSLAVADLVMAIFCMPFTFTMTMLKDWIFSAPMCPIVLFMQTLSVTASVFTNTAIGVDRFWVVMYPLKSHVVATKSRSKVVIAVVWLLAAGLSSIQLVIGRQVDVPVTSPTRRQCVELWPSLTYRRAYSFFLLAITYLLPLAILTVTYGAVGWKLSMRTTPGNADQTRDSQQIRSKRKVSQRAVGSQGVIGRVLSEVACFMRGTVCKCWMYCHTVTVSVCLKLLR